MDPVTFQIRPENKLVGLVEYIIVFPIVAFVILCVLVLASGALIDHAEWPSAPVFGAATALYLLFLQWLYRFAVYDYRRRAGVEVAIHDDFLTIKRPNVNVRVAYADVDDVRLVPCRRDAQCVLILSDGSQCRLPQEIALFSAVRSTLEPTLVRLLSLKLGERISDGAPVRVRDHRVRAWLRWLSGAMDISAAMLMMLTIYGFPTGLLRLRRGLLEVQRGWLGRNADFEVTKEGLRPAGCENDAELYRWQQVTSFQAGAAGLVLQFDNGRMISASLFAENYWPVAVWVRMWWRGEETHPSPG